MHPRIPGCKWPDFHSFVREPRHCHASGVGGLGVSLGGWRSRDVEPLWKPGSNAHPRLWHKAAARPVPGQCRSTPRRPVPDRANPRSRRRRDVSQRQVSCCRLGRGKRPCVGDSQARALHQPHGLRGFCRGGRARMRRSRTGQLPGGSRTGGCGRVRPGFASAQAGTSVSVDNQPSLRIEGACLPHCWRLHDGRWSCGSRLRPSPAAGARISPDSLHHEPHDGLQVTLHGGAPGQSALPDNRRTGVLGADGGRMGHRRGSRVVGFFGGAPFRRTRQVGKSTGRTYEGSCRAMPGGEAFQHEQRCSYAPVRGGASGVRADGRRSRQHARQAGGRADRGALPGA